MQDRQIELRAVEREHHVERIGILAAPQRILDVRDLLPFARIGIVASKHRGVVLPEIVHHHQEAAVGRETDLMPRRVDLVEHHLPGVLVDLLHWILALHVLVELQEGHRFEILLRVKDADAAAQPHHCRCPAALGMPDRAVGATQRQWIGAGHRAFLDEQLAHRHHFPVDLVALRALVVVEPGLRIGIDLLDGERAALHPGIAQLADIGRPVVSQRRLHLRRRAIEAGGDVLLAIGHEVGLCVLGVDGDMHAEPQPGAFRHVLDQLHLRAVEAHAIDVGASRHVLRGDRRRKAVDERVLAALRAVDELEAVHRIGAGKGAEMVADRIVVAVVPVPDGTDHAVRVEVHGVGAATHLGRQQRDPVAQALPAYVGAGVDELARDVVALCFGVVGAGMAQALVGDRSGAQNLVAEDRRLGDAGRADGDVEYRAAAELAFSLFLDRGGGNQLAPLACVFLLLEAQVPLELGVIFFRNFVTPPDEGVDLRAGARKLVIRRHGWNFKLDVFLNRLRRRLRRLDHRPLSLHALSPCYSMEKLRHPSPRCSIGPLRIVI